MTDQWTEKVIPTVIQTLSFNGFKVAAAETRTNYYCCIAERSDVLGATVRYMLTLTKTTLSKADLTNISTRATRYQSTPILISKAPQDRANFSFALLTLDQFFDRLGGVVLSLLPLQPDYDEQLVELGHNRMSAGLSGTADDLFEEYVHAGLQFILGQRVVRYGQERRFEAVPDGIAFDHGAPLIMYDAKAAKDGYEVSTTSSRQFGDYAVGFNNQYGKMFGRLTAFLVISGSFADSATSLTERSAEFRAKYDCPLSFLPAREMAEIVNTLKNEPLFRRTIDWRRALAEPIISAESISKQLLAVKADKLVGA